ncbi:hypothetical protein MMC07_002990 [Pseudocyphellaria aurata]|nr:hypothetical protein [Pseudocyphellaria aurata]
MNDGTEGLVLTSQLDDWEIFQDWQKRIRENCMKHGNFFEHVDKVRNRRRKQGLEGDACLLPDLENQTQLDNWIEFQFNHLERRDNDEMEVKTLKEKLVDARKKLDRSGPRGAHSVDYYRTKLESTESLLQEHDKMLRWIEQERKAIVAEKAVSVHTTGDPDRPSNIPTSPPPPRKRKQKPRSPLGPVRVPISKKPTPEKKRSKQIALRSAESTNVASKAPFDNNGPCLQIAARATVAHARKNKQSAKAKTEPRSQPTGQSNRQTEPQQSSSRPTKTRSGREIKRPKRFGDPAK